MLKLLLSLGNLVNCSSITTTIATITTSTGATSTIISITTSGNFFFLNFTSVNSEQLLYFKNELYTKNSTVKYSAILSRNNKLFFLSILFFMF